MGVAGVGREVVVENMEGIGCNGEKESGVSSRGDRDQQCVVRSDSQ